MILAADDSQAQIHAIESTYRSGCETCRLLAERIIRLQTPRGEGQRGPQGNQAGRDNRASKDLEAPRGAAQSLGQFPLRNRLNDPQA